MLTGECFCWLFAECVVMVVDWCAGGFGGLLLAEFESSGWVRFENINGVTEICPSSLTLFDEEEVSCRRVCRFL